MKYDVVTAELIEWCEGYTGPAFHAAIFDYSPEIWYNYQCLDRRVPGRFAFKYADNKHNIHCGQSAPYQVDLNRPAVCLSNVGKPGKGCFVMITKVCHTCEKPFQVNSYRAKSARYCSYECRDQGYSKPQVETTCDHCGRPFALNASRFKYGRGKYCSPDCQHSGMKAKSTTARNKHHCLNCGKGFWFYPKGNRSVGAGKYCSRRCRDEHRIGENHPQYINGRSWEHYGPNWQAQRRKTLKRDNKTCQDCGLTEQDNIARFGQTLAVHHKAPYRSFGGDYKKANRLTNLITLCHSCHRLADIAIQRQERESNGT